MKTAESREPRAESTVTRVTLLFALLLALATDAGAQAVLRYKPRPGERPRGDPQREHFVVFSISGGISLGSYQAGVNWGLLELYRTARRHPEFARDYRIPNVVLGSLAGASAGNINTLLWATEACTDTTPQPPESSLFWQTWIPVGLPELLPRGLPLQTSDRALFDRGFFHKKLLRLVMQRFKSASLQGNCSVRIGATLTRLHPDSLSLDSLKIPTQRFVTAFDARVDTTSPRMLFERIDSIETNPRFGKVVLPVELDGGRQIDTTTIFNIVEASSAFPLAFQPKQLLMRHPPGPEVQPDVYLDGGIFDNNPVGLGLELARPLYERLIGRDTVRDTVSVIYVNPGRLRDSLARLRTRPPEAVPSGGLSLALRVLGGAVATARQYELQLLARDLKLGSHDTLFVRLTSRAHPVVGEHLHAFGAFLAQPFREYDFFVGVYDALHFLASEYTCRPPRGVARDPRCVPNVVAGLIARGAIDFGPVGPALLEQLFAREFRDEVRARAPRRTVTQASVTPVDSARIALLRSVHLAQESQWVATEPSCGNVPLPKLILCSDRLLDFLKAFAAAPHVRSTVERDARACVAGIRRKGQDPAIECQAALELVQLVRDPVVFASQTVDRFLERLLAVEHQVHQDWDLAFGRERNPARARRRDSERQITLLTAIYRGQPLRPRYGFEWTPTSAIGGPPVWRYGLPYYVGADVLAGGFDFGYRPTVYVPKQTAFIMPLSGYSATVAAPTANEPRRRQRVWYAGAGVGLAATGLVPRPMNIILPEVGMSVQALGRLSGDVREDAALGLAEVYGDFSLLVGRLRVALRYATPGGPLLDGRRLGLSIGVADLYGLAYWVDKLWE